MLSSLIIPFLHKTKYLWGIVSRWWKRAVVLLCILFSPMCLSSEVLVVIPAESLYWTSVYEPMVPVAKQLNIALIPLRPDTKSGLSFAPEVKAYLKINKKPDWVIWVARRNGHADMLELLEKHGIRSINISNPIAELANVGLPRQKYSYWHAEVASSNFKATYNMLSAMVNKASDVGLTPPYSLIAVAGVQYLKSAQKVTSAVKTAAEEIPYLNLVQMIHTGWQRHLSFEKTYMLLNRHNKQFNSTAAEDINHIDLIWAGNIDLALGAVDAVDKYSAGKKVQKPLVIGQGWHPKIFEQIEKRKIAMSVGGNHLHGIWALIMIYDDIHGKALTKHSKDRVVVVDKFIASTDNIKDVKAIFDLSFWKTANVKQFSKAENSSVSQYQFDIGLLFAEAAKMP